MDLGYGDMWESFEEQAKRENWSPEYKEKIRKEIREGINSELAELKENDILKRQVSNSYGSYR